MLKIFEHIKLLHEYNTLLGKYKQLDNYFKQSAYKHILNYESQQSIINDLEQEVLELKGKNAELSNNKEKARAVESLKERKQKRKGKQDENKEK